MVAKWVSAVIFLAITLLAAGCSGSDTKKSPTENPANKPADSKNDSPSPSEGS